VSLPSSAYLDQSDRSDRTDLRSLKITQLGHRYGTLQVLLGLDLELAPSGFVALLGPSGSGKSTALAAVCGLLRPSDGQILLGGEDPYALGPEAWADWRAKHIGCLFQQFHLLPWLNLLDNVLLPSLVRPVPEANKLATGLLEGLGLGARLDHRPAQLSVGEIQRAALARALLGRPKLLVVDGPTGNLDDSSARLVIGHLRAFAESGGMVLMATHDPRAVDAADRVIELGRA
jgi:putative ABC transport system ATP-binding protein